MTETEDDENECGDTQNENQNNRNSSKNESIHDSDSHIARRGKKRSSSGKEVRNESDWYDCLAASPEGGLSISAAWTSSDIRVEVSVMIR